MLSEGQLQLQQSSPSFFRLNQSHQSKKKQMHLWRKTDCNEKPTLLPKEMNTDSRGNETGMLHLHNKCVRLLLL